MREFWCLYFLHFCSYTFIFVSFYGIKKLTEIKFISNAKPLHLLLTHSRFSRKKLYIYLRDSLHIKLTKCSFTSILSSCYNFINYLLNLILNKVKHGQNTRTAKIIITFINQFTNYYFSFLRCEGTNWKCPWWCC